MKNTTADFRSIDVRRWKRDGLLVPGKAFGWQWSSGGEVLASIHVRVGPSYCYELAYPSQQKTWDDRAARWADRIREKLGWEPGILSGDGWKPKGMHWNTFERLTAQHDAFVQIFLTGTAARLNPLRESLDDWI